MIATGGRRVGEAVLPQGNGGGDQMMVPCGKLKGTRQEYFNLSFIIFRLKIRYDIRLYRHTVYRCTAVCLSSCTSVRPVASVSAYKGRNRSEHRLCVFPVSFISL